ncbi:MAG: UbiA family prenyltransferase [Sediminibacterium sp.]|nr:UbiA family prenyltransferase [Sediminibacterium sp.]
MVLQWILLGVFAGVLPLFFRVWKPDLFFPILKDIRLARILHYYVLFVLGAGLYKRGEFLVPTSTTVELYFDLLLFFCILLYAAVFAIVTNNIEDIEADRISNPDRPLVKGVVKRNTYYAAGIVSLVCALILAFFIGYVALTGIVLISLGYYIYSCKPFRLKRYVFIAKSLIGFNSLVSTVTGFCMAGGTFGDFPVLWLVFVLGPLTFAANFVDLKDIEGDRLTDVNTLPVLLGEKNARTLITVFTIITYLMGAFLIDKGYAFILAIVTCTAHIYFLYRKPYRETPVFIIYISALIMTLILLLI